MSHRWEFRCSCAAEGLNNEECCCRKSNIQKRSLLLRLVFAQRSNGSGSQWWHPTLLLTTHCSPHMPEYFWATFEHIWLHVCRPRKLLKMWYRCLLLRTVGRRREKRRFGLTAITFQSSHFTGKGLSQFRVVCILCSRGVVRTEGTGKVRILRVRRYSILGGVVLWACCVVSWCGGVRTCCVRFEGVQARFWG